MTPKTGLATALVAAVVAALVTAATLLVIWRAAPGVVDAPVGALDEKKITEIVHAYLTKNPEILVEMTTELDKRQAEEQAAHQQKGHQRECRHPVPLAARLCRRQSRGRRDRGRVLRLQLRVLQARYARAGQDRR